MAGYPYLDRITDPGTKMAVQKLWEDFNALRNQVNQLQQQAYQPQGGNLNAGGGRIVAVANPQADTDAVNLRTLRNVVQAQVESF